MVDCGWLIVITLYTIYGSMLIRTVRMTFRPDRVDDFLREVFEPSAPQIRAFAGCRYLELWQDTRFPNILSTFSHWDDEPALERYRASELFRTTWARTTPLFAAPASAHSHVVLVEG